MARKHKPEEIIGKLREAEIVLAEGGTVADAWQTFLPPTFTAGATTVQVRGKRCSIALCQSWRRCSNMPRRCACGARAPTPVGECRATNVSRRSDT